MNFTVGSSQQKSRMKLLVVDDDAELCSMLQDFLRNSGFAVEIENDAAEGAARVQAEMFDLVVLDVMMPGVDGFEILRRIRSHSRVPVMMLTAKSEKRDRIEGFESGADDYLTKPFYPEELLARAHAILRRCAHPAVSPPALSAGDLQLFPGTRTAFYRGRPLELTAMECEILEQLIRSAGHAVTRDQLSMHLYGRPTSAFDRSIDTHVSRIRRKMGGGRGLILSVRGTGYQLCEDSECA